MDKDIALPFDLPAVCHTKVTVAFAGGRLSSDGGVLLLHDVERGLGIAERLVACRQALHVAPVAQQLDLAA